MSISSLRRSTLCAHTTEASASTTSSGRPPVAGNSTGRSYNTSPRRRTSITFAGLSIYPTLPSVTVLWLGCARLSPSMSHSGESRAVGISATFNEKKGMLRRTVRLSCRTLSSTLRNGRMVWVDTQIFSRGTGFKVLCKKVINNRFFPKNSGT